MYFKFLKEIDEDYEINEDYEPTEEEIIEYGMRLGLTLPDDEDLLYIARKSLKYPLPRPWRAYKTLEDEIYYKNTETHKSQREHPCEIDHKQLVREAKSSKFENQKIKSKIIETLRNKTAEILRRPYNPELEVEFRAACSAYEESSSLYDHSVEKAYQDYLNAYQQKTSLYNISRESLIIYNTETETKEIKILKTPKPLDYTTSIAQLPNGKLFCYGGNISRPLGTTMLIDVSGGVEVLQSGTPCIRSSCIYFNNSIYCFGGKKDYRSNLALSSRFNLDQNRWIQLIPLPKIDCLCNSMIFNGNTLISGYENKNLWLYSIDIDSFSTIPYEFAEMKVKILINAERLYLIECGIDGSIYECESGNYMSWRRIGESKISFNYSLVYCSCNKGEIYIGTVYEKVNLFARISSDQMIYECYRFDLKKKLAKELFRSIW